MVNYYNNLLESLRTLGIGGNSGMFTSVTLNSKTLRFNFTEDYTPIDIHVVDNQDVVNLNILFNYLMQGAVVTEKLNTENPEIDVSYEVDMSFEDKEKFYKFNLDDFSNKEQETEGFDELEKDPLVAPYLKRILEHAEFVYNFTNELRKDAYHNETIKYTDNLEVKYVLDFDSGDYDIIIKTKR